MTIPTKEELTNLINQLKARMYEIEQESKIVTSRIAFYSGQLEILNEENSKSSVAGINE